MDGGRSAGSPEAGSPAVSRRFRVAITIDAERPDRPTELVRVDALDSMPGRRGAAAVAMP